MGAYTLQLPAGSATITATLTGYQSASTTVTVTAAGSASAPTLQITPLNPGTVTGQVVNSSGAGLTGVTVVAQGLATATAAGGGYTLSNLPAGAATIAASLAGFQSASAGVTVVAGSTVTAPVITLASGSGTITGTVKSSAGTAISGATVQFGGGIATTSATGTYTLSGVPTGTVQLVASANGFQGVTQNVVVAGGATAVANFSLSPVAAATGTVTGKITNASTGAAISDATVSWSGGSTATNASGVYTLTNVKAGSQGITASKTGFLARTGTLTVAAGATGTLNLAIATAGKITVKVTTASGAVVSGTTVSIKGGVVATTVPGTTSAAGTFTTNWIPVGSYTVTATKTGHAAKSKAATVTSGVTTTVAITSF
jgi:hypothetical protein